MMNGLVARRPTLSPRWRLLGLLVVSALAASATVLIPTSRAVPTGITLSRISPLVGGELVVARTAADDPLDPPTFQLKADVYLNNSASTDTAVTSVTISYPGSGISSFTYPPQRFFAAMEGMAAESGSQCDNAMDEDGDGVNDDGCPPAPFIMAAGTESIVPVYDGLNRDLPTPLPPEVHLAISFDNDPTPLHLDYGLTFRDNHVPNGAHFFPGKASDLAAGEYWFYGTRHVADAGGGGGALNPSTGTQRYALDLAVVRWDAGINSWSDQIPGTDGADNEDFWGFGKPMYATADGVIKTCYRGEADHQPGSFNDISFEFSFGNSLFIRHSGDTGDQTSYAHMKDGSIPAELCPADGLNENLHIPVKAGQFLGEMGDTGRSTRPHLHLQVEHIGINPLEGVPINFLNIRALADDSSVNNLGETPTLRPLHGLALHSNSLILPNPCGLDDLPPTGLDEVNRQGIPAECYQDVYQQLTSRGYRPLFVDGYDVAGQTFFNATFRSGGPDWVAQRGLDAQAYQDLYDEQTDDGYRLQQVDSYLDGGSVRYAAIFEDRTGPPVAAFHGLNDADYLTRVADLRADGFVAVNVSTVEVGGQRQWTGLFEQVNVAGWTVETVKVADFQATSDGEVANGRVPIYVHGFSGAGGPFLTGIWVQPLTSSYTAVHDVSIAGYQAASSAALAGGRRTRAVTGFERNGAARFAGVWRAAPHTVFTTTPPALTHETTATFGFAADNPFTTFLCRLDAAPSYTPCTSPTIIPTVTPGDHTFRVRAFDREGVGDPSVASFDWRVTVATTTTVASSANPAVFGQPVAFTATVAPVPPGSGTPTGTVQFKVDGLNFGGPVALIGGKATSSTSTLAVGTHMITALYGGEDVFDPSSNTSAPFTQTVNKASTATALTSSANPVGLLRSVTFTATVTPVPPGAGTRTGTVQFKRGNTNLGPPVPVNAAGQATRTVSALSLGLGTSSITAVYSGDAHFNASTSAVLNQQVRLVCLPAGCLL